MIWKHAIESYLRDRTESFTISQLAREALGIGFNDLRPSDISIITGYARRLGWRQRRDRKTGAKRWFPQVAQPELPLEEEAA